MVQPNIKLEVNSDHRDFSPTSKKPRFFPNQAWSRGMVQPNTCANPLEEPSPLGLTLRKTPSLLDLIQMKLSHSHGDATMSGCFKHDGLKRKDAARPSSSSAQASADKLKASNFPVSLLRIGTWECKSRYEGDLVAKCYFAKHKLVWEVLEGGLKSKLEIQWSDITALKATFPDNEPATLEIEISRYPLFFKETNPQPRKHTLWQGTVDFTGGQASICRRHFLQCPHGLLNRHYEKLIQCDPRLNSLSKNSFFSKDSPYFEPRGATFHERDESSYYGEVQAGTPQLVGHFDQLKNDYLLPRPCFPDSAVPVGLTLAPKLEPADSEMRSLESITQETPSPSSVMDTCAIEEPGNSDSDELNLKGSTHWEPLKIPVSANSLLQQESESSLSTSVSSLTNQIGGGCQEETHPCTEMVMDESCEMSKLQNKSFDEIAQHLLNDSFFSTSDEQAVIRRVNSLFYLLQKDLSSIQEPLEMNAGDSSGSVTGGENVIVAHKKVFDEIAHTLLNDNHFSSASDEQSIIARVNSLRCLLQKDACGTESNLIKLEESVTSHGGQIDHEENCEIENEVDNQNSASNAIDSDDNGPKQAIKLPRKESSGDLLLHLPRIASFPQIFFGVSDDFTKGNESAGTVGGL